MARGSIDMRCSRIELWTLAGIIFIFIVPLCLLFASSGQTQSTPSATSNPAAPPQPQPPPAARKAYAQQPYVGDDACRSCHQSEAKDFHYTTHYLTSQLPSPETILGSFKEGENVLKTSNERLVFKMEAGKDGFTQTAVDGTPPNTESRTERFGVVFGSGSKGQTYAFWKNDQLFQLPVSYWNELGWVNSPGYRDGVAEFRRPIIPRCLECHATYFESLAPPLNRFNKTSFVVGIACEKCHGPGRNHIEQQNSKSNPGAGPTIANPAHFSRERQLDLCAWCHAGLGVAVTPSFSYVPGKPLNQYIELPPVDPNAGVDVHGSQVELLEKSRCFKSSTMTCSTCHDVHVPQHDLAVFSQHCLSCHKEEGCGMFPKLGHAISSNCVDCHMPNQPTNLIVFDDKGKKMRPRMRNHWIKVYAEAAPAE
jgi:hypothetical protein